MAKIDEITALLIDEIDGFNQSIQNLSKISNNLKTTTIKHDDSELKQTLQSFYKKYELLQIDYKEELKSIQAKINTVVVIPKGMTTLLILMCSLFLVSASLSFYQFKQKDYIRNQGFNDGKIEIKNHVMTFFKENPKAHKTYRNWLKRSNKN